MYSLILMAGIGQVVEVEGNIGLVQVLKDAQIANKAALRSGRIAGHFENRLKVEGREVVQKSRFEVIWDGVKTFWKIKLSDPLNSVITRPVGFDYGQEPPWEYILRTDKHTYIYDNEHSVVSVRPNGGGILELVEVNPLDAWFFCCPPDGKSGTPWTGAIGIPPFPPGTKPFKKFSILREGKDLIRQTRTFADGSRVEATFSMSFGGNVISTSYEPTDIAQGGYRGMYTWVETLPGVQTLKSWRFTKDKSQTSFASEYNLYIDRIDIDTPVNQNLFNTEHLYSQLPKNIILNDLITGKRSLLNVQSIPRNATKELEHLIPELKSKGFLKKGPY